ncbi:MAG: hypothetical protein ACRC8Y_13895, partial [Chroococcales cyanobacterium]
RVHLNDANVSPHPPTPSPRGPSPSVPLPGGEGFRVRGDAPASDRPLEKARAIVDDIFTTPVRGKQ